MAEKEIIEILNQGGVGVLPTDTIYGLVGQALKPETVTRIRCLKNRSTDKPLIVLIGQTSELAHFGVKLGPREKNLLKQVWPGPTSIVFPLEPASQEKFIQLHAGTGTLAFRLPDNEVLVRILRQTGPLAAPSANPEARSPATTIEEARSYFGNMVDFYLEGGKLEGPSSRLIALREGEIITLRG